MTINPDPPPGALHALALAACAAELRHLAAACDQLEDALARLVATREAPGPSLIRDLQDLDRIRQTLQDMAPLMDRLATQKDEGGIVDALAALRLGDLRQRLGRGPPEGGGGVRDPFWRDRTMAVADIELF